MAALGHSYLCMRTKMNRYNLRLWDVRKRPLYVEKRKASKPRGVIRETWLTPPPPRRNKTLRSCPGRKVFLR
jgi:hypothetical protein